jgi:hypothetical protein
MKDEVELEIGPDGVIRTIYQDGIEDFAKDIGADVTSVCRLTNVEWEEKDGERGWSVRAAHNPSFAIRNDPNGIYHLSLDSEHAVILYDTREKALKAENFYAAEFIEARRIFFSGNECSIEGSRYGCPCGFGSCEKGHIL